MYQIVDLVFYVGVLQIVFGSVTLVGCGLRGRITHVAHTYA
jgi:hypothetical protein